MWGGCFFSALEHRSCAKKKKKTVDVQLDISLNEEFDTRNARSRGFCELDRGFLTVYWREFTLFFFFVLSGNEIQSSSVFGPVWNRAPFDKLQMDTIAGLIFFVF